MSPQGAQTTHDTTSCQLGRHQFEPRLKYLPFATDLEEWDENLHVFFLVVQAKGYDWKPMR